MRLPACEGWTRLVDEPNDIYATNRSRIHGWLARMHGRVRDRPSLFRRYDNPCPAQPFPRFFLSIFLRFRPRSNDLLDCRIDSRCQLTDGSVVFHRSMILFDNGYL